MMETRLSPDRPATPPVLLGWGLVGLLILFQGALFFQYARREVTWFVPRGFDQAAYLEQAYRQHDRLLERGLARGTWAGLTQHSPNGVLLPVHAGLWFLLLGPTRLAALALNFAFFAAYQGVLVAVLRWRAQSWPVALYGLGLLLTASTPFMWAGGLADFRIDFVAFCLFGILLCAVVRSGFLTLRRWAAAAGVVAGLLVLYRFITAVYLAGILGLFMMSLGVGLLRCDPEARRKGLRRLSGALAFGLTLAAVSAPLLWHNREHLWAYYVGNHLLGPEKNVRAAEFGVTSTAQSLLFYPRSVVTDHAGPLFLLLAALGAGTALLLRRASAARGGALAAWFFMGICLVVPWVVLTANVSKSPVVGGILVPPLLWLSLLPLVGAGRGKVLTILASVAVACGAWFQAERACRRDFATRHAELAAEMIALYEEVFDRCRERRMLAPVVSVDSVCDLLWPTALNAFAFECHGLPLGATLALGGGILEVDEATALRELGRSDFVLFTGGGHLGEGTYPFFRSMEGLRPIIRDYCDREMVLLREFDGAGRPLRLYMRPLLAVEGDSGGWVTSRGLTLSAPAPFFRGRGTVCLEGCVGVRRPGRPPGASVLVGGPGGRCLPAAVDVDGDAYRVRFTVPPECVREAGDGLVRLHVRFDAHFVPRALGLNEDRRELVVLTPSRALLTR